MRTIVGALVAAWVALALLATGQANASPVGATSEDGVIATPAEAGCVLVTPWYPDDGLLADSCDDYAWADWNADGSRPEVFAVASDRTIWHAWSGSGGWRVMPGNGRADDILHGTDS